ncbi:hypothetical protein XENOCAPTIV_002976 [Xenoophorus captivus]|uniref:Uncharacterized protein n=1 Tax=Xenoophorus captivus TaxID=1517983 RepID=A0ABV0RD83_9TELE
MMSPTGPSPNPNVPSEYCSTIPPLQQARAAGTLNSPPPTVMVPISPGSAGLDPGGGGPSVPETPGTVPVVRAPVSGPWDYGLLSGIGSSVRRIPSLLPDNQDELPPLLISTGEEDGEGKFVEELDNITFTNSFLDSKDHAGMLFFSPTCQSLDGLTLPPQPFLFGLLIQKLEVPWAKVFPLRLLLRLGAEYDSEVFDVCMFSSVPNYCDKCSFSGLRVSRDGPHHYEFTGCKYHNTSRNYQYSLSVVEGLRIHMEMGHSYIEIPKASFSEKVVNSSNEHVISIGASFSQEADSHLVCFQNEEGNYQTQANSKPGKTRTDGLMVQIPPETMESLRSALREQTDFHIPCGKNDGGEVRENVTVRWVDRTSPMCDMRRSLQVFYQLKSPDCSLASVLSSCSMFQKEIAFATCSTLAPHLSVLTSGGINSLWLRISTQADMVEYQAGSGGRLLPQRYMNEMDGALIPVIHGGSASVPQAAMDMELVFYITHAFQ